MKTSAIVLLTASLAQAADLKELLESADRYNVDRRISAEARERAEWEYRQAWTSLLPAINTTGSWTINQFTAEFETPVLDNGVPRIGPDGNPVTQTLTILPKHQLDSAFRFDLPIIDTNRWFRSAAGAASASAAAHREQATRDSVRRQVVAAWYSYAAALAVLESAKRSTKVAQSQAELQEIRAKAGAATELELLRARAEVERNRQIVADTQTTVAISRRSVRTLSGMDPGDEAPLPATDDMREPEPFLELEKSVEQLPQVKAADRDAEAAGKTAMGQRLAVLPTVGAQFTERVTNATGFIGEPASFTGGVAFAWRLDVPTFMGMGAAAANERAADIGAERARLVARDQIHSDWQRLEAGLNKVNAARVQQEANARAAQVARDRYAAGAATQLDVITAERDLLNSEVAQIQARTELAAARLALRISTGQPLLLE